jgi:hypothetical protein
VITWNLGGNNLGNQWNYGSFGYYLNDPYVVVIRATRGGSPGAVALDDIIFKESQYCSISPSEAIAGTGLPLPTAIPTTTKSGTTSIPSVYDCSFEVNFCTWTNDYSRPLNWTRNKGTFAF